MLDFIGPAVGRLRSTDSIPNRKKPDQTFYFDGPISDRRCVFPTKRKSGHQRYFEEGVVIVATLYDENNRLIDQNYTYVMESGLWKIELKSPSASYKSIIWLSKIPLIKNHQGYSFRRYLAASRRRVCQHPVKRNQGRFWNRPLPLVMGFTNKVLTKVPGLILPDWILPTRSAVLPITLLGDWPKIGNPDCGCFSSSGRIHLDACQPGTDIDKRNGSCFFDPDKPLQG